MKTSPFVIRHRLEQPRDDELDLPLLDGRGLDAPRAVAGHVREPVAVDDPLQVGNAIAQSCGGAQGVGLGGTERCPLPSDEKMSFTRRFPALPSPRDTVLQSI